MFSILKSVQELLDRLTFEVASYRSLTDEYVYGKPVGWLFSQFWQVQKTKWIEWTGLVTGTELALSRTINIALSSKKKTNPPLPNFDDVMGVKDKPAKRARPNRPSLASRIETANKIVRRSQAE